MTLTDMSSRVSLRNQLLKPLEMDTELRQLLQPMH